MKNKIFSILLAIIIVAAGVILIGNELFDLIHRHRALFTRLDDTALDLERVKRLACPRVFDNENRRGFHSFVRGEALVTLLTFPTTPDGSTLFIESAIDNLAVHTATKHTFHSVYLI